LTGWKSPEKILNLADIVVAHRLFAYELDLPYPHRYVRNIIVPISSSLVRERIAHDGAWRSLVVSPVRAIIESYGLYRHR